MQQAATTAWAPLVAEVEGLASELPEAEREAVARFLERVADAAERLARDADTTARDEFAVPLPALWA